MDVADPTFAVNTPTLVALAVASVGAIGTATKLAWTWMTGLIDKFQAEAVQARKDFLEGLQKLEGQRQDSEKRVHETLNNFHETLVGIHEILRERGIPGPHVQQPEKVGT